MPCFLPANPIYSKNQNPKNGVITACFSLGRARSALPLASKIGPIIHEQIMSPGDSDLDRAFDKWLTMDIGEFGFPVPNSKRNSRAQQR